MFQSSENINRRLKERLQRIIRKYSLIDTGEMYRSIQVNTTIDSTGNIWIKIYSVDYLKYHWDKFPLASDFEMARGFDVIITDALQEWATYQIRLNPNLEGFLTVLSKINMVNIELMN